MFSDVNGNGTFTAPDVLLRAKSAFPLGDTFDANNGMSTVIFNREGFALGLNNIVTITLHAAVPATATTRCLQITIIGQLATEPAGTGNCA